MKRTTITLSALAVVAVALCAATYRLAYAGGPDALIAAGAFNPVAWPWGDIALVVFAGLGAIASVLRVLAPLTKSTADDRLLGWVDWLLAVLARIVVPGKYREALATVQSIGLGNGKGGVGDQPPPPPAPATLPTARVVSSSGRKSGGGA
jgi:hypothetical protein